MKSKKNYLRVPYGCSVHNEEEKVAQTFDKKYGIMLNSGSSALLPGLSSIYETQYIQQSLSS